MSEMKIVRFVNLDACKSIFSEHSTFVLRSFEHYRTIEDKGRCDKNEARSKFCGGGGGEVADCFVLSCWTMLDGDEPTPKEWGIFPDSFVAIVSTPSKVSAFLESAFEIEDGKVNGRRFPFLSVDPKKVTYADEIDKPTPKNFMDKVVFNKDSKFKKEKEYRFALAYGTKSHTIESYIFSRDPDKYMEKCFANPQGTDIDKEQLQLILWEVGAGYGHFSGKKPCDIIANYKALF